MKRKRMTCKKCKGNSFSFEWKFKNEREEASAYFAHDGWGFQLEDSTIKCDTCGTSSEYEKENFIVVEVKK